MLISIAQVCESTAILYAGGLVGMLKVATEEVGVFEHACHHEKAYERNGWTHLLLYLGIKRVAVTLMRIILWR